MRSSPRFITAFLQGILARLLSCILLTLALSAVALAHAASVYVPVDSWVYPASERLAVLTGTRSEILGLRPWTRLQFARFIERAKEMPHSPEADELQAKLETEFAFEVRGLQEKATLESSYVRTTQIAGEPLRDSYHYGQSFVNDFGRPYGEGFNAISGSSGYVQEHAGMIYLRGEYQRGASLRPPPEQAIEKFQGLDEEPSASTVLTQGGPAVNNPRLLDAYVGTSFGRWTATLGKQSLWWGPAVGGAFLESNNAEPIWMARLTNDLPYKLPVLGRARVELFYGQLQGHNYMPGVWLHGEKLSLQPFKSVEINFSRTTQYLGAGRPFTWHRLWISYFNVDDGPKTGSTADSAANDPGDRRSGVDFSWKLPRIPVTLYSDSFSDDEPSPLASPTRSCFHPGLYIARLPGPLARLDLRMEGAYTVSENPSISPVFNYWNGIYKDGYTNKGLLIGDTVGRSGVYWQAWSTYWLSPRNKIQVSYRNRYIDPKFIAGGGTQGTASAVANFVMKHDLEIELGAQSERYDIPLLTQSTAAKYDTSGWAGITYRPTHKVD